MTRLLPDTHHFFKTMVRKTEEDREREQEKERKQGLVRNYVCVCVRERETVRREDVLLLNAHELFEIEVR